MRLASLVFMALALACTCYGAAASKAQPAQPASQPLPCRIQLAENSVAVIQLRPPQASAQWLTKNGKHYLFADDTDLLLKAHPKPNVVNNSKIAYNGSATVFLPPHGWGDFGIDVPADGEYYLHVRFIHHGSTGPLARVLLDGQEVATVKGWWWAKADKAIKMTAGKHVLRLVEAADFLILRGSNRILPVDAIVLSDDAKYAPDNDIIQDPVVQSNDRSMRRPYAPIESLQLKGAAGTINLAGTFGPGDLLAIGDDGAILAPGAASGLASVKSGQTLTLASPSPGVQAAVRVIRGARLARISTPCLTPNDDMLQESVTLTNVPAGAKGKLAVQHFDGKVVAEFASAPPVWNGRDNEGKPLPNGSYVLVFSSGSDTWVAAVRCDSEQPPVVAANVNAFSPNGDGVYDAVTVSIAKPRNSVAVVKVLNTAGRTVRENIPLDLKNMSATWDGKAGEMTAPAGFYDMIVEDSNGKTVAGTRVELLDTKPLPQKVYDKPFFPMGVWYNGRSGMGLSGAAYMDKTFADLVAHNCNTVAYMGTPSVEALDIAHKHGLKVMVSLQEVMKREVLDVPRALSEPQTKAVLEKAVAQLKDHPALLAYYLADEPRFSKDTADRMRCAQQVLAGIDGEHPGLVCLIGLDRIKPYVEIIRPALLLIDVYPLRGDSGLGQFDNIYRTKMDCLEYTDRSMATVADRGAPTWIIHAAHGFGSLKGMIHRQPTPAEVRSQAWLSLTRGVDGFFYFFYQTMQTWAGLVDDDYKETDRWKAIGEVYGQLKPHTDLLLKLRRVEPVATVAGGGNPWYKAGEISTLSDGEDTYLVIANRDVEHEQNMTITLSAPASAGSLLDLKSGKTIALVRGKASLDVAPGDGTILKLNK